VATLHVEHSSRDGSIVAAVVEAAAKDVGLDPEEGANLALAAGAVARAVYRLGFDDPEDAALDLSLARIGHQVVVRIDDRGLPFNGDVEDADAADVIADAVGGGWIDSISHESLGRDGNRTTLVRHVDAGTDLRDQGASAGRGPAVGVDAPIVADTELVSRFGVPADAEAICRLTWRTYGFSYQHDEYYQPERLATLLESGMQASFVVATPDGEIIGHSAVLLEHEGDVVVEGGRAMVDPRFRGHHLMRAAKELREEWMDAHGVLALEGAAVTAHTRSQTDRAITSIQLAFIPAIEFRGIDDTEIPRREAVAGGIFPVAPIPPQSVAVPVRDAAMIREIYRRNELIRDEIPLAEPAPGSSSDVELEVRADLGHAVLTLDEVGHDLASAVRDRVSTVARGGIEVVYADIPLDRPDASWAADVVAAEGFIFSGILPLARQGVDLVRYQRLGTTPVDPADIHLKHPFGPDLLEYVLAQRAALDSPLQGDPVP
jgi:hypothetical protein